MNNLKITNGTNNISFNSRKLRIIDPENFPKSLLTSIKTNKALDEFIQKGKPKTLREKFRDLFKKNEYLNISYKKLKNPESDIYYSKEKLSMQLGEDVLPNTFFGEYSLDIIATQHGVKVQNAKDGFEFKPPAETAAQRITRAFESITDFEEKITNKPYSQSIYA